jgi:hypothetical protein
MLTKSILLSELKVWSVRSLKAAGHPTAGGDTESGSPNETGLVSTGLAAGDHFLRQVDLPCWTLRLLCYMRTKAVDSHCGTRYTICGPSVSSDLKALSPVDISTKLLEYCHLIGFVTGFEIVAA